MDVLTIVSVATVSCTTLAVLTVVVVLTQASAPWAALRRARVRTIYYQTEPILVPSPPPAGARHGAAARWCMVSKANPNPNPNLTLTLALALALALARHLAGGGLTLTLTLTLT